MPFEKPTLAELRTRAGAQFEARLPGADTSLRKSNLRVSAEVMAGLVHGAYGYLDYVARQSVPDTAEGFNLERWAAIFGIVRIPAGAAEALARFTGSTGSSVPTSAVLSAQGQDFVVVAGGTLAGGQIDLTIRAVTPGAAGNLPSGSTLSLVNSLTGIDAQAILQTEGAGGADVETDALLRARMLTRLQAPPQGGAETDYRVWALEVAGVTRAWVYPGEQGAGTVVVRFAMDDVRAAEDGIPQGSDSPAPTGDQALVYDYIEPLRPVTARLYVVAPVARAIDVTIAGLTPDTPEIRQEIASALAQVYRERGEPGGVLSLSWIWETISLVTGERSHTVTTPAADVQLAPGELPVPGIITYG
ncbi:MAG: baseplate J/gp47 family protein [Pseudomonadota bacterium]